MSGASYVMKQCLLTRWSADSGAEEHMMAWLPSTLATERKAVRIGDIHWRVDEVWPQCLEVSYVVEHERDWRKQREASDI